MKANVKTERRDGQNLRRQSTVGLLLLTLLVANPLQVLGQGVIDWTSYDGVYLNDYFSPPINTVTVRPSVYIDNSNSGSDAIWGDTHTWNLTINGSTLAGDYNGVNLTVGGSVNNSGGSISGGNYGVTISGKAGSVVNSGSIWAGLGGNDGVRLRAGGSVNNLSGGSIEGYTGGVKITGGAGTVNNAGSITGDERNGVYMDSGGTVNNLAGGTIYGNEYGVEISGGAGYVTNYGSITGNNHDGVRLRAGGTVDNESGNIWGYTGGVKITGGEGTVINGGSIMGYYADGVYMDSGGSVYNFQSTNSSVPAAAKTITDGLEQGISGYQNGVAISGGLGNVYNNSSIIGGEREPVIGTVASAARPASPASVGYDGVYLGAGGSVYNDTNGFISGSDNGVNVNASPSSVVNRGSIYGGNSGVYMGQGSTLSNLNGTITGGDNGVFVSGGAANVYNRGGTIVGQTGDGVFMNSGGTVINKTSKHYGNYSENDNETTLGYDGNNIATIEGAEYGVLITGDTGTVINSGTIIGTNNAGVRLEAGGTVVNQASQCHGNNWGNDNNTTSEFNGNTVPTISGGNNGVLIIGGLGFVTNSGSISGGTIAGVWLSDGGTVVNQASRRHGNYSGNGYDTASSYNENTIPTIVGGDFGVLITGSTNAVVINSGTIIGTNNAGVRLEQGGTVVNQTSRHHGYNSGYDNESASSYNGNNIPTISGGNNGVVIVGGTGYVYNDGDISATPINITPTTAGSIIQAPSSVIGNGVIMSSGGTVENGRHGTIEGYNNGVVILGGTGYVYNHGNISVVPVITPVSSGPVVSSADVQAQAVSGNGVYMNSGGTVDNDRHGTIEGGNNGVVIIGDSGNVSNDGDISGVPTILPGSVVSSAGSVIQAGSGSEGVVINGSPSIINSGSIIGNTGNGVILEEDGTVINMQHGISAGSIIQPPTVIGDGVYLGLGGTVDNGDTEPSRVVTMAWRSPAAPVMCPMTAISPAD